VGDEADIRDVFAGYCVELPPLSAHRTPGGAPVWSYPVDGAEAFVHWRRLRAIFELTGWWPYVEEDGWRARAAGDGRSESEAEVLARGRVMDGAVLLAGRYTAHWGRVAGLRLDDSTYDERQVPETLTEMLDDPPFSGTCRIGLVEAGYGWEVPARVGWGGGGRRSPEPAGNTAVLRYWQERWGAEVLALGDGTLELLVSRPPRDRHEAVAVARELIAYCPDLLLPPEFTLGFYAARYARGVSWRFWWD
jgi:hypothetical protein